MGRIAEQVSPSFLLYTSKQSTQRPLRLRQRACELPSRLSHGMRGGDADVGSFTKWSLYEGSACRDWWQQQETVRQGMGISVTGCGGERAHRADTKLHGLVDYSRSVTTRWSSSELALFTPFSLYIQSDVDRRC
jgi:hypothetical protein